MQGISDQFGVLISLIFIEVGGEGGNILYILYHLFPPSPLTPKGKKNISITFKSALLSQQSVEKTVKKHFNLKFPRGNYKQEKEKNIFEIMKNTLTVTPLDSHLALEKYSAKGCILTGKR